LISGIVTRVSARDYTVVICIVKNILISSSFLKIQNF
jgi:hypothetical protein